MWDPPPENVPLQELGLQNEKFRLIFQQCDTDKDGCISIRELVEFINSNSSSCGNLRPKLISKLYKMADSNGDKLLDYEEFVNLMNNEDFQDVLRRHFIWYVYSVVPHQRIKRQNLLDARYGDEEQEKALEFNCCPPPILLFLISVLELALFVTDQQTKTDNLEPGALGESLLWDPMKKSEVWRYLTYMFVHINYRHIIFNLIFQLVVGIPLEMANGSLRILHLYFIGGITGCLAHGAMESVRLGGASGGVYALITAHLSLVIMNWKNLPLPIVQFLLFGIFVGCDLGSAIYQRYYLDIVTDVGITCHLGGAVSGFLVGIYSLRNVEITKAEKYFWWIAVVLYVILLVVLVVFNIGAD